MRNEILQCVKVFVLFGLNVKQIEPKEWRRVVTAGHAHIVDQGKTMKIFATLTLFLGLFSLQGCFDSSNSQTQQHGADASKASVHMQKPDSDKK